MRKTTFPIAAGVLAMGLATAIAQTTPPPATPPAAPTTPPAVALPMTSPPPARTTTAPGATVTTTTTTAVPLTGDMSAKKLLGTNIKNGQNETIGEVEDLLVGKDGKVEGVIVSVGGFLGLGERHVALTWDKLQLMRDGNSLRAQAAYDKETLKALPEYSQRDGSWVKKAG
jgi:hypothetical protein